MAEEIPIEEVARLLSWRVSILEQAIIDADKFPMPLKCRKLLLDALEYDHPSKTKKPAK